MARAGLDRKTVGPVGAVDDAAQIAFEGLLAGVPPPTIGALLRTAVMIHASAGDLIVRENQEPFAGVLVEGRLRTVVTLPDGRSASIHYMRPTAFFGLPTIFTPTPLSVHAVTDARAIALDAATLIEAAGTTRGFGWFIARQLAMAVARVPLIIEHFAFMPVQQRVAVHLLALADPAPAGGDQLVHVTQAALAEYVGTAREVVSRSLHALATVRLIRVEHRRVVILDPAGLQREAAGASVERGR